MRKIWQENEDGTLTFSSAEGKMYELDPSTVREFKIERRGNASLRSERHLVRLLVSSGENIYVKCGKDLELCDKIAAHLREKTDAIDVT
jgi:hypothetical protein